ncbi:MAG: uroporphyrinogen decarboxylase [Flavobacteriia bacterium]|nr:uroporphyrinogen decarboxylase [Flavobacteriia bacterium]
MALQNDLLLKALRGEEVPRPPVWMMRQAGRYLPDFMKLKEKYPFFERIGNPEMATEITLQPIDQVGVDAAILFSDILVIPQALGIEVQMVPGKGPYLPNPIREEKDLDRLVKPDVYDSLGYVYEAIKLTKKELNNRVPLIGFAGSPWTILCYMVEGQGSKEFAMAKSFCFQRPDLAHKLLNAITDATIAYLKGKIEAGVDVIQLFDSWGGMLGPQDYNEFSLPYLQKITDALKADVPVVLFGKGCWYALGDMAKSGASALGVDWTLTPQQARQFAGPDITLQGNFDPSRLLSPIPTIEKMVKEMIDGFGTQRYIANLGHGILPTIPVDHAKAFVNAVKNYQK